eukprot:scaffold860_cov155-Ochromonas_danica.AAC.5
MLKSQSALPPTPERRPPLADGLTLSTAKPTPAKLRSHRKLPDTPSSSNLIEQCLNDLDEIVKNGSPTSSEILSLLINKHNSDEIAAEMKGSQEVNLEREIVVPPISSSKVIMKCVSDLDDMIARRKKELSDIHRSGGQRSTQRKKMRKIGGDTPDASVRRLLTFENTAAVHMQPDEKPAALQQANLPPPLPSPPSPLRSPNQSKQNENGVVSVSPLQSAGSDGANSTAVVTVTQPSLPSTPPETYHSTLDREAITADHFWAENDSGQDLFVPSPVHSSDGTEIESPEKWEERHQVYKALISQIESSLRDPSTTHVSASILDPDQQDEEDDVDDGTSMSSEDICARVMHDGDVSYDLQANVYYISPAGDDRGDYGQGKGIAEAGNRHEEFDISPDPYNQFQKDRLASMDENHYTPVSPDRVENGERQEIEEQGPSDFASPEVEYGDIYASPDRFAYSQEDVSALETSLMGYSGLQTSQGLFDNEQAAQLLKYKLNLKNEILKSQVNAIAHWLETEYLERNNRFKTLLDEQQKILGQKIILEEELTNVQDVLHLVRTQSQLKSARVLDLETELTANREVIAARTEEVEVLKGQCFIYEERMAMIMEELASFELTKGFQRDCLVDTIQELRQKEAELQDFCGQYDLLVRDFDQATADLTEVINIRDELKHALDQAQEQLVSLEVECMASREENVAVRGGLMACQSQLKKMACKVLYTLL